MELARKVGWHHYMGHRETMSEAEWMREYTAWRRGQDSKVMVATSAFSTGNDYPHVHLVLHVDKPFDMLEYVQAQGGSGHDGASATCHTLVPSKTWKKSKKEDHLEQENEQAILDHLYLYGTKRCLCYGITSYTDGKGVGCLDDDLNERCSVCRENVEHRPRDIQMATMPQRQQTPHSSHPWFPYWLKSIKHLRAFQRPEILPRFTRPDGRSVC